MRYSTLTTPIGELLLTADDDGALTAVDLPNRHRDATGWERDDALLIVARGEVVWIVGHAIAQNAAVTPSTPRIAQIDILDEAE